jgi:hypothetical protein
MLPESIRRRLASLDRWEVWAYSLWGVALLAVCCRTMIWPRIHSLYPIFALAAEHWRAGIDLYDKSGLDYYRYSPLVAALFVPFSLLPEGLGNVLWRLLSLAVFMGAVLWWHQRMLAPESSATAAQPFSSPGEKIRADGRSDSRRTRALLLLLLLPLTVGNLNNGQSNMLLIGLLLAAVTAASVERWNLAAICVVVATVFKVYPLAIGLLLAAAYPRRMALRLGLFLGLALLLPFLMQRPGYVADEYARWLHHLRYDTRTGADVQLWYRDLRIIFRVLLTPLSGRCYLLIQMAGGAATAALCLAALRARWPRQRELTLLLGLGCCWMTVLGPATESSTYVLLAPANAWLIVDAWFRSRPRLLRWHYFAVYALFILASLVSKFPNGRLPSMVMQPAAGLLLYGGIVGVALWEIIRARVGTGEQRVPTAARAA